MTEGSDLDEYAKRFPTRFRDVAIAEQHSVTYAAGLACGGMKPVVAIYSTFAQRAYDQIEHDVALQHLPVLFAVDRGGIVGADGPTHHGLFDIACFRQFPGFTVFTPSGENECRLALNTAYSLDTPTAVRYPRGKGPGTPVTAVNGETIPIGKSVEAVRLPDDVPEGQRVIFLSFGAMTWRLTDAVKQLRAGLIDMRFAKPLDREAILDAARRADLLVTAEEGVIEGGAGDGVLEVLAEADAEVPVLQLGVPDRVLPHGSIDALFRLCGLDTDSVVRRVTERLRK